MSAKNDNPGSPQGARENLSNIPEEAAQRLGSVFDSVQIIAVARNAVEGDTESTFRSGAGSLYERLAATREWLMEQDEYVREYARMKQRREMEGGEE